MSLAAVVGIFEVTQQGLAVHLWEVPLCLFCQLHNPLHSLGRRPPNVGEQRYHACTQVRLLQHLVKDARLVQHVEDIIAIRIKGAIAAQDHKHGVHVLQGLSEIPLPDYIAVPATRVVPNSDAKMVQCSRWNAQNDVLDTVVHEGMDQHALPNPFSDHSLVMYVHKIMQAITNIVAVVQEILASTMVEDRLGPEVTGCVLFKVDVFLPW
mmetsp:Transcript_103744/g.178724  ORF Transcript_103744/g.178724 Transcript_103744/m.178724 type:complete len:209 (+) Transcript_103744:1992-2618(+)